MNKDDQENGEISRLTRMTDGGPVEVEIDVGNPVKFSVDDMHPDVMASLQKCVDAGKYMVATFRVHDGDRLTMDRITNDFPTADLKRCVDLLERDVNNVTEPLPETPLPRAKPFPRAVPLVDE